MKYHAEEFPDQAALFPVENEAFPRPTPDEEIARIVEQNGASVDISTRAEYLGKSLALLSQANRLAGFQQRADSDNVHHSALAQRYGKDLQQIANGAAKKQERLERSAMDAFAEGSGMYALMRAGMSRNEAQAVTRGLYNDFTERFGVGAANARDRNKLAKKLTNSAETITNSTL